ncbi:MAG: hypothetical protein ABIF71_16170 [Planctomycetota bacterium]
MNRAGRLVDIASHLPYEGRVTVTNRSARRVALRVPGWVPRRDVRLRVGDADRPLDWVGRHLLVDDLKPGDIIDLTFPLGETMARYTVNPRSKAETVYTCTFRGSTLVDISPRDMAPAGLPLYRRDVLRKPGPAPMVKQTCFVPDRVVRGW